MVERAVARCASSSVRKPTSIRSERGMKRLVALGALVGADIASKAIALGVLPKDETVRTICHRLGAFTHPEEQRLTPC